jgi:hypothetical protein
MKNIIAIMVLMLAGIVGVSAQTPTTSQSANEGYVGVTVNRSDIKDNTVLGVNRDTDSIGVNAGYTRYFGGSAVKAGVVGVGAELGYNFGENDSNQVTALGSLTLKARNNKYVQPYVRGLVGTARQNVQISNVLDVNDWSLAYGGGVGADFKFRKYSRYGARIGVDLVRTNFFGEHQNAVRGSLGFVF